MAKKRSPGKFAHAKEGRHVAEVITILNDWWGGSQVFKKMPSSGALRWGGSHFTYGDLVPPEDCPFVFELKSHAEIEMDAVLRQRWDANKLTWFWYGQTIPDAIRATQELGKTIYPIMIYKITQTANRVVIQDDIWNLFPKELTLQIRQVRIHLPGGTPFVVCPLSAAVGAKTKEFYPGFVTLITRKVIERYLLGIPDPAIVTVNETSSIVESN